MTTLFLNVATGTGAPRQGEFKGRYGGLWVQRGRITVNDARSTGQTAFLKNACDFSMEPTKTSSWVHFELSDTPNEVAFDQSVELELPDHDALLRLDEVKFPPGAVAYRHVHPGPGFRVLTDGELRILSDTHQEIATPGHIWFEPANSPVRAEASATEPVTSFVRFMVLPVAFAAKPTIHVLDAAEATLPRLQVTQRHIDEVVQLSSG